MKKSNVRNEMIILTLILYFDIEVFVFIIGKIVMFKRLFQGKYTEKQYINAFHIKHFLRFALYEPFTVSFKIYDFDGDGLISHDELYNMLEAR